MSTEFKLNSNKSSRRIAFRIYERANLFYHKIDPNRTTELTSNFNEMLNSFSLPKTAEKLSPTYEHPSIDQSLPNSHSQESDTLNVNISSSGIAFTSRDELKSGDYLMLRILLLSTMTVILTCCKVIYCKPSNPYENDRYPYLIGACFVNLRSEDRELLNRYINRRRKQQLIINGLILTLIAVILVSPAQAFGLLLQLSHHMLVLFLHGMHVAFEYIEYALDHLIEHSFHTNQRVTQIIVFYILLTFGLAGLYIAWRIIPSLCMRAINNLLIFWTRKKASFLYYWEHEPLPDKIRIISIGIVAIACYAYFAI